MDSLYNTIDVFVSGDWGNENSIDLDHPIQVSCIRGADIVPIERNEYNNIPQRFITSKSFSEKKLKEGDIIIEKSGGSPVQSTGRVVYVSKKLLEAHPNLVCSNFCVAIRIKKNWNPLYIFYYIKRVYEQGLFFNFEGKTSGIKNLDVEAAYKAIPIEYRNRSEQDKSISLLTSIERKITVNRQINRNLEALAKQLYDYWFVQFDFPNEEGKPYKSSGGKMVWNEKLRRNIPQNWECKKICEVARTCSGGTPMSSREEYYKNGNIPWINSGELNNSFITSASNYITKLGLDNSSAKLYPPNTILVALYGATAGKVSLLTFEASSNQAVCGVIMNSPQMTNYIRYYLSSLLNYFVLISTGSARDNISQETIKNIWAVIPEDRILALFDQEVEKITQMIVSNQTETETLTKQRDELLPLLMNGQVSLLNCD